MKATEERTTESIPSTSRDLVFWVTGERVACVSLWQTNLICRLALGKCVHCLRIKELLCTQERSFFKHTYMYLRKTRPGVRFIGVICKACCHEPSFGFLCTFFCLLRSLATSLPSQSLSPPLSLSVSTFLFYTVSLPVISVYSIFLSLRSSYQLLSLYNSLSYFLSLSPSFLRSCLCLCVCIPLLVFDFNAVTISGERWPSCGLTICLIETACLSYSRRCYRTPDPWGSTLNEELFALVLF